MYRAFNLLGFLIGGFACAWGAAAGWPMLGPLVVGALLAAHSFIMPSPGRQLGLVAVVALLGTLLDSLLAGWGVTSFPQSRPESWLCPLWITALWINLGLTLHGGLSWLQGRYVLAGLLGAIGGPLAYWGAAQLGAIYLDSPWQRSLGLVALAWALVLPLIFWLPRLPAYRLDLAPAEPSD